MSEKLLMVCAMYEPTESCLGVRIGTPRDISKLTTRLIAQIRKRYPEYFSNKTPKQVKRLCTFPVFDIVPDKRGFPRFVGEAEWYV